MPVPSYSVLTGKAIKRVARLRGGGSALPGLVVERIDPDFLHRTLSKLPHGVVLISGTNGKTTTTKMVVALLESQGLKVFTNRTGSNFTRGVVAALIDSVDTRGTLDADIAVLELDEAHAVHFVRAMPPTYCLLLNVMRDQLDRFGEIDTTAKLLRIIARETTDGIVINRDDPRLGSAKFVDGLGAKDIRSFGVNADLAHHFPSDDSMRDNQLSAPATLFATDTSLQAFSGQQATFVYDDQTHDVDLKVKGIYNVHNAVGAIALTRLVMGNQLDNEAMLTALSTVEPAFGRGESILVNGQECELILVKNPSGFRLSLASFLPSATSTMIAINDKYADGRDMSWLWDVEFDSLAEKGVAMVSGSRAYDMALRLQYSDIEIDTVKPDLVQALSQFLAAEPELPHRIFCTYTAMLKIRRELSKIADVEVVS